MVRQGDREPSRLVKGIAAILRSRWLAAGAALLLAGCESSPDPYVYRYVPGRTATLGEGGIALAPPRAPADVQAAIAAGNRIAGSAYVYGGGHGGAEGGFDCSGATSYVLRAAGVLRGVGVSREFRRYGERGAGEWIDVYARNGHVFLAVAGLRFDTGGGGGERGPHWTMRSRAADGYVLRHPAGL